MARAAMATPEHLEFFLPPSGRPKKTLRIASIPNPNMAAFLRPPFLRRKRRSSARKIHWVREIVAIGTEMVSPDIAIVNLTS
jgi:hypothetical protein